MSTYRTIQTVVGTQPFCLSLASDNKRVSIIDQHRTGTDPHCSRCQPLNGAHYSPTPEHIDVPELRMQ